MTILHPFLTASISPRLKNRQGQKALFNRPPHSGAPGSDFSDATFLRRLDYLTRMRILESRER
jgi:hypothetical protein